MKRLSKSVSVDLLLLVCVGLLLLLQKPKRGESCGPMFDYAILHYSLHPDLPLDRFAAGHLGILEPTYARSYLAVAYRYLVGQTIDTKGQRALHTMWKGRLGEWRSWEEEDQPRRKTDSTWQDKWDHLVTATLPWRAKDQILFDSESHEYTLIDKIVNREFGKTYHYPDPARSNRWEEVKANLYPPTLVNQIEEAHRHHRFEYVFEGAFQNAVLTYRSLAHEFGARSSEALDWVATYDTALASDHVPAEAAPSASTAIRKNRIYLIGASHFYHGDFDLARERFFSITSDKDSRWHAIASYLAARTYVRQALLADDTDPIVRPALQEAIRELTLILDGHPDTQIREWSQALLRTARAHYDWSARQKELAVNILLPHISDSIADLVADYTATLDHTLEGGVVSYLYGERPTFVQLPKDRTEDMTDWVMTFQVRDSGANAYVFAKWQKTKTLPWLVSALSRASRSDKIVPALLAASENIKAESPAYQTVRFHEARLLVARGENDRARDIIDAVLNAARNEYFPASSRNQFQELRLKLAQSYDEMVAFLERRPAALSGDYEGSELPFTDKDKELKEDQKYLTPLDEIGVQILSYSLPNSYFTRLGATPSFSHELRARLDVTGWVRAVLANEDELAQQLAKLYLKEMPVRTRLFARYSAATTVTERHYEAIGILLHAKGFSPYFKMGLSRFEDDTAADSYRDNWWCSEETEHSADSMKDYYLERGWYGSAPPPARTELPLPFLTPDERHTASDELSRIRKCRSSVGYLNKEALTWAKAAPNDPRMPEMLHRAVQGSRYGCEDEDATAPVKAAFTYLHKHYPKSPWTKRTKYWF